MKKVIVLASLVFGMSLVSSCENNDVNEETAELDQLEIFQVDRGEIDRPGEQGSDD